MAPNPYAKYAPPADAAPANPYARYAGPTVGQGPSDVSRAGTYIDNLGRMFANGAFLGFADELTAAASAATVMPQRAVQGERYGGPQPGDVYDEELKRNRLRDEEFSKANPTASILAQVAGGLSATPMMPFLGAVKGAGLLTNTLRGAATGAGYGGVAGFGHGTGGLDNRLLNAGIGTVGGGVLGGVAPGMIAGASLLGRMAKESPAGQFIGREIMAPAMDKAAGVVEALAPKMQPKSLSAAAPDGGVPVPVEGFRTSVAEMLRNRADAARSVAQRGAQERVARDFERYSLDPRNVGRELDRIGDGGVLPNAAPPGTLDRTARTAYDAPGQAASIINEALDAQRRGAPRRMVSAFEGDQPPPTVFDARRYLEANKSQVGTDVYDPLRAARLTVSSDMQRLMQTPAIREAYDQMVADAAKFGRTLTPFDFMHGMKRQLNQNADAAFASGKPINKEMVGSVADQWERSIYAANPQIQAADQSYARAAQLPDLLEQGRQFLRTGTGEVADAVSPSALAATLPQLDDAGRLVFGVGATNTVRDKALQGPGPTRRLAGNIEDSEILQEKLAQIYGPERARAIINAAGTERSMLRTDAAIRGGPNTASKIAHLVEDGLSMPSVNPMTQTTPGVVMALVKGVKDYAARQNAGNEPVRAEIARILMERNPNANLQNLDVIEAIMRQRLEAQARNARIGAGASSAAGGELGGAF